MICRLIAKAVNRIMGRLRLRVGFLRPHATGEGSEEQTQEMPEIGRRLQALAHGGGRHFFDPARQDIYPEKDFRMCIDRNRFDYVLKIEKDRDRLVSRMIRP